MKFDVNDLKWIRKPKCFKINENEIEIITEPHTDFMAKNLLSF